MKHKLPLSALFLFLCLLCLAAAPPAAKKCLPKPSPVASAVLFREEKKTYGSGVQIRHGKQVLVLTCAHVVADLHYKQVRTFDDTTVVQTVINKAHFVALDGEAEVDKRGDVVWYDPGRDVALVRPDCPCGLVPAKLPEGEGPGLARGDELVFCGGGILDWNYSKSWLSRRWKGHLVIGAGSGWFGHSGSGVWNKGRVVGMLDAGLTEGHYRLCTAIDLKTINASLKDFDDHAAIEKRTQAREE